MRVCPKGGGVKVIAALPLIIIATVCWPTEDNQSELMSYLQVTSIQTASVNDIKNNRTHYQ